MPFLRLILAFELVGLFMSLIGVVHTQTGSVVGGDSHGAECYRASAGRYLDWWCH